MKFQINDTYGNNVCESKDVIITTKKLLIVSIAYTMQIKYCLATTGCNIIDYQLWILNNITFERPKMYLKHKLFDALTPQYWF